MAPGLDPGREALPRALQQAGRWRRCIALRPAGFPDGYDQLRQRADPRQVAETSIEARVASLEA